MQGCITGSGHFSSWTFYTCIGAYFIENSTGIISYSGSARLKRLGERRNFYTPSMISNTVLGAFLPLSISTAGDSSSPERMLYSCQSCEWKRSPNSSVQENTGSNNDTPLYESIIEQLSFTLLTRTWWQFRNKWQKTRNVPLIVDCRLSIAEYRWSFNCKNGVTVHQDNLPSLALQWNGWTALRFCTKLTLRLSNLCFHMLHLTSLRLWARERCHCHHINTTCRR